MTQPLDTSRPWESGLITVLGADPMDRMTFLGMPWLSRIRWYTSNKPPAAAGDNMFNLFRKVDILYRNGGAQASTSAGGATQITVATPQQYVILEGQVNWYQGGPDSPHDSYVRFINSSVKALSSGPVSSTVLNPNSFETAAEAFYNGWSWLGSTIQTLEAEIKAVDGPDSGFNGTAAGAFVQNLKDLQDELKMMQADLKANQDWVQMLHDNAAAARAFWRQVDAAWDDFWGHSEHDPSGMISKVLSQIQAQAAGFGASPPNGVTMQFSLDFGTGARTYDLLSDASFSQLNTDMQTYWIASVANMDATMASQYVTLRDSLDTTRLNMHDMRTYLPVASPGIGGAGLDGIAAGGGGGVGAGLDGIAAGGGGGVGAGLDGIAAGGGGGGEPDLGGSLNGPAGGGSTGGGSGAPDLGDIFEGGGSGGGSAGGGGSGAPALDDLIGAGSAGPGGGGSFGGGGSDGTAIGGLNPGGLVPGGVLPGGTGVGGVGSTGGGGVSGPGGGFSGLPGTPITVPGLGGGPSGGSSSGGKNSPGLNLPGQLDADGDGRPDGLPTTVSPGGVQPGGGSNIDPSVGAGKPGGVNLPGLPGSQPEVSLPGGGGTIGPGGGSTIPPGAGAGTVSPGGGSTNLPGGGSTSLPGGGGTSLPGGGSTSLPGGGSTSLPGGGSTSLPGGGSTSLPGGGGTGGGFDFGGGASSGAPGKIPDGGLSIGPLGSNLGAGNLEAGAGGNGGWATGASGGGGMPGSGVGSMPGAGGSTPAAGARLDGLSGTAGTVGAAGASSPGSAGAAGMGGYPPMMPPMMPMGGNQQEKERERTTWLAEDEEVWGTDPDLAPSVLGRDEFDDAETSERAPWQPVPQNPNAPYGPARGGGRATGRG
ncbi:hypothetical protein [Actinoplanes sp. HUAS TT8]|uniref:hypothetical protein n=1 Tax=Actinoplanes sp. HUAS TT8 TaxID=3447453 RepID=UPI003F51DE21